MALAAAGCSVWAQTNGTPGPMRTCSGGGCSVPVEVVASGSACTITPPGDILVPKNQKPTIVWEITNTGGGQFKFVSGGIQFNNKADPVPAGEFTDMGPQANGAKYQVKDDNKSAGATRKRYNYKITVVKPDGSAGCVLDPVVVNDGCDTGC
jgi:hypothetical protein